MSQTSDDYNWRLRGEGQEVVLDADLSARASHLHAFNFGRAVARLEHARYAFWLRVRWLLFGAAVGVTIAVVYFQAALSERILHFVKRP